MKLIVLGILFTGLSVFSTADVHAQTQQLDPMYSVPSGNFVDAATAIFRLEADMESIKFFLSQLNPNSSQFRELEAKYVYYDNIRMILTEGKGSHSSDTAAAIAGGMRIYAQEGYETLNKTLKLQYRENAIQLLRP